MTRDDILERLKAKDSQPDHLLEECRIADPKLLERDRELCLAFCEKLISHGFPGRALDLASEAGEFLKESPLLVYRLAHAANRGGNPIQAKILLKPLLDQAQHGHEGIDTKLQVDIVALQGSILKQQSVHNPLLARESAEWYEKASALPGAIELPDAGTFPLINAATMWRIAGDDAKSLAFARETLDRLNKLPFERIDSDYWMLATIGEANLLLGLHGESVEAYSKAAAILLAKNDWGEIGSMRRNLLRLQQLGLTADTRFLDEHLGTVVVFSGHLIDSPDRLNKGFPFRFPNNDRLVEAVKNEVRKRLDALNARVGFCSLGSGGDILFAEAMIERNAELHVLLPFNNHDFLRTSVTFGLNTPTWRRWGRRFEDILDRIPQENIRYVTTEPYLGSEALWTFSGRILQGMAIFRAQERVSQPKALLLIDRSVPGMSDGTRDFGETWETLGFPFEEIDLKSLRETHWKPGEKPKEQMQQPPRTSSLPRPIKSILFADIQGFSKLLEWQFPEFLQEYRDYLGRMRASPAGQPIKYMNTWGDGIYVVFDRVAEAAEFANELLHPKLVEPIDWSKFQLGSREDVPFRIGLHSGPVFELPDLFHPGHPNYSGQHVTRAARIEPVTLRGCAYATENFAAMLTIEGEQRFYIELVGMRSLAKDYDKCRLYRIDRK